MRCNAKLLIGELNEDRNERAQQLELETDEGRRDERTSAAFIED